MHPKSIFIFILSLAFCSCHKNEQFQDCGELVVEPLSEFQKQFNFKPGSSWTYSNTSTGDIDTLSVISGDGVTTEYFGPEGHMSCQSAREYFTTTYSHNLLFAGSTNFSLQASIGKIFFLETTIAPPAIFEGQPGDSILLGSMHVKLEQILPTYQVQSKSFNNVSVVRYAPSAAGFNRLWWCPGEGIIEAEFLNPATKYHDHWQLIDRKVELFN